MKRKTREFSSEKAMTWKENDGLKGRVDSFHLLIMGPTMFKVYFSTLGGYTPSEFKIDTKNDGLEHVYSSFQIWLIFGIYVKLSGGK